MDPKTQDKIFLETNKTSYIFKTFEKRMQKNQDDVHSYRVKMAIADDL